MLILIGVISAKPFSRKTFIFLASTLHDHAVHVWPSMVERGKINQGTRRKVMKRRVLLSMVCASGSLIAPSLASAIAITEVEWNLMKDNWAPEVTVDGETKQLAIVPVIEPGTTLVVGYRLPRGQSIAFGDPTDGATVTTFDDSIQALFDPVITSAIGFVDYGAPSSISLSVAAPLAPPITTVATGSLSISGSFADGAADGGSATPFGTSLIAQATIEGIGVADAGPAAVFSSPADVYGPHTVNYKFDCTALGDGQCDSFDLQVSFTGSGGDDAISFTARHEINPIPVPAAVWLFGSGLLGMVGIARRKKAA
jgi:hypothetical protein